MAHLAKACATSSCPIGLESRLRPEHGCLASERVAALVAKILGRCAVMAFNGAQQKSDCTILLAQCGTTLHRSASLAGNRDPLASPIAR